MRKLILAAILFLSACGPSGEHQEETTFARVLRTHVLRCGYILYPGMVDKDPNTGQLSGLYYDIAQEIGQQLGVKIEWGPELAADTGFEGLGRTFDANCTGYTPAPTRTFAATFSKPAVFMPYVVYTRADETRFKTLSDFNSASVKIATLDGELSQVVAREQFPKAQAMAFPGLTSVGDRFEAVVSGKADMIPIDAMIGADYAAKNPGRVKLFPEPLRVGPTGIALPHGEPDLKAMIDVTIDTMQATGALARIIAKNVKYPGTVLLPAQPYEGVH